MYSIYVMRKVRIRTILGFYCANLGSKFCAVNPRIVTVHALRLRKPPTNEITRKEITRSKNEPFCARLHRFRNTSDKMVKGHYDAFQKYVQARRAHTAAFSRAGHVLPYHFACHVYVHMIEV